MTVVIKRILISLVCIPLILLVLFKGGVLLLGFLSLLVLLGTYELRHLFKQKYCLISNVFLPLNILFLLLFSLNSNQYILLTVLSIIFIVSGYDILTNRIEKAVLRLSLSFFTTLYTAFFLSYAYRINSLDGGCYLLVTITVVIWITDTFAYFLGMTLGKHRGIFSASPNKSLEGFLFGFVAAVGSSYLLGRLLNDHISQNQALTIGLTVGIFGQFGDLLESLIKRDVGIKDSSSIIPGHGGVLDRFDSFIFTLPVFYLINSFL